MIHVSDIRKYERCETLLWRTHHEPQPFFPFVHPSASISELAVRYFGLTDYYEGSRAMMRRVPCRRWQRRTSW